MSLSSNNIQHRLQRAHSAGPSINFDPLSSHESQLIASADVFSYKIIKKPKGKSKDSPEFEVKINTNYPYTVFSIYVTLKSGLKWVIEKRYSEFRELRKEVSRRFPSLEKIPFPAKKWLFNFSNSSLKKRMKGLRIFLSELASVTPQIFELSIFLEIDSRVRMEKDKNHSLLRRTLSFGSLTNTQSIKDFHLIKVLGKGSFGKVFLVRPSIGPHSEVYAMKIMRKTDVINRQQVVHTLTERAVLSGWGWGGEKHDNESNLLKNDISERYGGGTHPFLLSLRLSFHSPSKLYLIMDYCPGGELFFHLKRLRRFTESMMRFYAAQIAAALGHLHHHKVVYRDLKPENILLDRQGYIKLTDFGLSRYMENPPPLVMRGIQSSLNSSKSIDKLPESISEQFLSSYAPLTFCGTPEYLSPEMILHRKKNSKYSYMVDYWSLGIVCYELITGWPPFYDKDFTKMCEKIIYKQLSFPKQKNNFEISKDCEDFIRKLLIRDPNKRMKYNYNINELNNLSSNVSLKDDMDSINTEFTEEDEDNISNPSPSISKVNSNQSITTESLYIQDHPFFKDFDWNLLLFCQLKPPYVPPRPRDITDTINFDREFTKINFKEMNDDESFFSEISKNTHDIFNGFSFSTPSL